MYINANISHSQARASTTRYGSLSLVSLFYLLTLVICSALSELYVSSIVSISVFIIYLIYLLILKPLFFVKYFAYLSFIAMNVLGCFFADQPGIYLSELQTQSFFVGSLPLLVLTRSIFILLTLFLDESYCNKYSYTVANEHYSPNVCRLLNGLTAVVLALISLSLIFAMRNPPAFSMGIGRFQYSNMYEQAGLISSLASNLDVLIVLPLLSIRHGNKKLGIVATTLYIIYLAWIGNKFGSYFFILSFVLLVYFDKLYTVDVRIIKRVVGVILLCFLALVYIAVTVQSQLWHVDPVNYLQSRLAQQGQLWWMTYAQTNGIAHISEFENEVVSQVLASTGAVNNVGSTFGMYGVMYRCAPADLVNAKLLAGSAYTEAGYAAIYYYLGTAGVIFFSVLMSIIVVVTQNGFLNALANNRFLESVLLARFTGLAHSGITMFIYTPYFNIASIASYAYLILAHLMRYRDAVKNPGINANSNSLQANV